METAKETHDRLIMEIGPKIVRETASGADSARVLQGVLTVVIASYELTPEGVEKFLRLMAKHVQAGVAALTVSLDDGGVV